MIPRYSRDEASSIWTEKERFSIFLDIECAILEYYELSGFCESGSSKKIRDNAVIDVSRIHEIEETTKHEMVAFLESISEQFPTETKMLHYGVTTSDIFDTCLSVQLVRSSELLIEGLEKVRRTLKNLADRYRDTNCIFRTHGMHAEASSFGLKFLQAYAEFSRHLRRLRNSVSEISVCMVSGAVGNYSITGMDLERHVSKKLGLMSEPISTQVIPRDRHAYYFSTLSLIAASIDRLCIELRHLQRTEVSELEEKFTEGQTGSSAMPHKKNPILSENLCGIARLIKSYCDPAYENVSLWHERDISHSSVERVIAPDATILLDFSLTRLNALLSSLVVNEEKIENNLRASMPSISSQRILAKLIDLGFPRSEAYSEIQRISFATKNFDYDSYVNYLKSDEILSRVLVDFDFGSLKYGIVDKENISQIFERVLEVYQ